MILVLSIAAFLLGFAGGYGVRELVSRRRYYQWRAHHWYCWWYRATIDHRYLVSDDI